MPVAITKYLCQFRCGTKAKSTLQQIQFHERVCFKNPDAKTCLTCKHEIYEKDVIEITDPHYMRKETMVRACNILSDEDFAEEIKRSDYHSEPAFHKQPVRNCSYWESKQSITNL